MFGNGTGNLQDRISLPHPLSPNYDALVVDGADNLLVGITGTGDGIAVIDLTSINEPQPLPHERFAGSPSPDAIDVFSPSLRNDFSHLLSVVSRSRKCIQFHHLPLLPCLGILPKLSAHS